MILKGLCLNQLLIIEDVYHITMLNKEDLVKWITDAAQSEADVITITTSLNTWVALKGIEGPVVIPKAIIDRIVELIAVKRRFNE